MVGNGFQWNHIHSIRLQSIPFKRYAYQCNGYLSIGRGGRRRRDGRGHAAGSGALLEYGAGNPSPQAVFRPAAVVRQTTVKSAASARLANVHSTHDNYVYRASFTRRNRPETVPEIPPPETRP